MLVGQIIMLVGQIIKCGLTCEGVDIPQILLRIVVQEGKRNRLTYKLSIFLDSYFCLLSYFKFMLRAHGSGFSLICSRLDPIHTGPVWMPLIWI